MPTQFGGVSVWPETGSGASSTTQTITQYLQLGSPGSFSYPSTALLRVGSPSVADNRNVIAFEPNAGGTDIVALATNTSDHVIANGVNLQWQTAGVTRVHVKDAQVDLLQPLTFQKISTSNAPLMQDTTASAESALTAEIGSLTLRRDGQGLDYKVTGVGNTGWRTIVAPIYGSMSRDGDGDMFTRNGTMVTLADWDGTSGVTAVGVTEDKAAGTFTIVTAGKYRLTFTGRLDFASNASETVEWHLAVNGTRLQGCFDRLSGTGSQAGSSASWPISFNAIVNLAASDVVAFQISATTVGTYTAAQIYYATMTVERVA